MRWFTQLGLMTALITMAAGLWSDRVLAGTYSGLVVDMDTGRVLYERNADELRHPASITKMMTLYLVFEALARGEITLDSRFRASRYAVTRPPSKLGLSASDTIAVEDAILALVTQSANDVATLIGENLGGSEPEFAYMMTRKARELGMRHTTFRNASGLPDPDQWTTAWDMYRLGKALIQNFPEYYRYFSTQKFYYRGRGYGNHNHLMETYPGMDGIKTGFINSSGFNLVASARRGGHRLIGVVFGGPSAIRRDAHMRDILDDGFAQLDGEPSRVFTAEFDRPEPPGLPGRSRMPGARVFEYSGADDIAAAETPVYSSRRPPRASEAMDGEPQRASRLPPPQRSGRVYGETAAEFTEPPAAAPRPAPRYDRRPPPVEYAEAEPAPAAPPSRLAAGNGEDAGAGFVEPATVPEEPSRLASRRRPAGTDDAEAAPRPTRRPPEGAVVFDSPEPEAERTAEFQEPEPAPEPRRRPARTPEPAPDDYVEPGMEAPVEPVAETRRSDFVEPETVPEAGASQFDERPEDSASEPRRVGRIAEKLSDYVPRPPPKTRALLYAQATASRRPEKPAAAPGRTPAKPAKSAKATVVPPPRPSHAAAKPRPVVHEPPKPVNAKRPPEKPVHVPAKPVRKEAKAEPAPRKAAGCAAGKSKGAKCGGR